MTTRKLRETWYVDLRFRHHRYRLKSPVNTRRGAEEYERVVRRELLDGTFGEREVPTFEKWFNGRFWNEWVIGQANKPSEVEAKRSIFETHLKSEFGKRQLDEIGVAEVAAFKARLVSSGKLTKKRINNILAVLSKSLRYAEDVRLIAHAPRVQLYKIERPEIEWWEIQDYARILEAAKAKGSKWYLAVCLAGEAGLRVGEIRALIWERDVDLVAGTITVNEQTRNGITGTPKGRTRRKIPMTPTLLNALKTLDVVRRGHVVRNEDGTPLRDGQTIHASYWICREAGLPERGWHCLRHTFGTHAAHFGANPWRLQAWMGHKRIDETMRYVHVTESHDRELPEQIRAVALAENDLDRRVIAMLGARSLSGVEHADDEQESAPRGQQMGTLPGRFRECAQHC